MVVKQPVGAPGELGKVIHGRLYQTGAGLVKGVHRFPRLEVHVGVLGRAANHRSVGGKGALAMGKNGGLGDQRSQIVVIQQFDLLHFVGGAKPVEEM